MAKWCPEKQNYALYPDCAECEDRLCEAFFCLVVGSRSFTDYDLLCVKLDALLSRQGRVVIVSGGAKGADTLAERYANDRGHRLVVFPANWKKNGKKAGFVRNREMQEYIAKTGRRGCVAFWDGESNGTRHSISLAKELGIPCRIIRF